MKDEEGRSPEFILETDHSKYDILLKKLEFIPGFNVAFEGEDVVPTAIVKFAESQ